MKRAIVSILFLLYAGYATGILLCSCYKPGSNACSVAASLDCTHTPHTQEEDDACFECYPFAGLTSINTHVAVEGKCKIPAPFVSFWLPALFTAKVSVFRCLAEPGMFQWITPAIPFFLVFQVLRL